jgi:hypothetical protein
LAKIECNEEIKAILVLASIALLNVPYFNENDEEAQLMSYIYALSGNNGFSLTCLHVLCAILFGIAEESDFQNQVSMKEYANFSENQKPCNDCDVLGARDKRNWPVTLGEDSLSYLRMLGWSSPEYTSTIYGRYW